MSAEVSLPGARFGARNTDWSTGGLRVRGGGIAVPIGSRGVARLPRSAGRVQVVAIEMVRQTPGGDPRCRFLTGRSARQGAWLREHLSLAGAMA
jgi:hypothetical protein